MNENIQIGDEIEIFHCGRWFAGIVELFRDNKCIKIGNIYHNISFAEHVRSVEYAEERKMGN